MSRTMLIAIVAVVAGVVFLLTRPEPTPQEKLEEAASDAVQAVSEAANEAVDAVQQEISAATEQLESEFSQASAKLIGDLSATTLESRDKVLELVVSWQESGIVTEDGIDLDAALKAIDASSIGDTAKTKLKSLLESVRDAPEKASELLSELSTALSK